MWSVDPSPVIKRSQSRGCEADMDASDSAIAPVWRAEGVRTWRASFAGGRILRRWRRRTGLRQLMLLLEQQNAFVRSCRNLPIAGDGKDGNDTIRLAERAKMCWRALRTAEAAGREERQARQNQR
jgi:hypothetical protein